MVIPAAREPGPLATLVGIRQEPGRAMLAAYDGWLRLAETGARLQKPGGQRSSVSERSDGAVPQRRQRHAGLGFAGDDGGWVEATQSRVSTAVGSS